MKKLLAVCALLLAIALVLHEARLPWDRLVPTSHAAPRAPGRAIVPTRKERERKIVPDAITLDKTSRHWVIVNPYAPEKQPTAMRLGDGGWSSPETVYAGPELVVYVGVEETSALLSARPTENWWRSNGFGLTVLKDYKSAAPNLREQANAVMEQSGVSQVDRQKFRFVNEAVFFNMADHTYTVVGRKYIDRYGETLVTLPEGFREVLSSNATAPDVDGVAASITSGVVHDLYNRQHMALDALRSSGLIQ